MAAATLCAPALADEPAPLRLCADPSNLPFSSDTPSTPGLYLEIGEALGRALGRSVTPVWYKTYFGKRAVRVTLLASQCDAMIGLPSDEEFMGPAVIFSRPLFSVGYVVATAKGSRFQTLDDLKGRRVAVQYQTSPQNLLALRDDIPKVTVLNPEAGMTALAVGKADAAFVWGPTAGWLNKTVYQQRFSLFAVEGEGLRWPVAIGFAKKSGALRDQVNDALPKLDAAIADLLVKYGLPDAKPIPLRDATHAPTSPTVVPAPAKSEGPSTPAKTHDDVTEGKELFNKVCGHCHGPNAVQAERRIDLRQLRRRHGDGYKAVFLNAVNEGRPTKGMPPLKEAFTNEEFEQIFSFVRTVQGQTD